MKKIVGACVLLVMMAGISYGDSCHQVQQVIQTHQAQIVTPVVQTQTLAVPVVQAVVPIYSAVYNPQVQNQTADNETLLKILEELKAMRQEINSLKVPILPIEAPKKEISSSFKTIKNSCYGCHNSDRADDHGGSFVMFKSPDQLVEFEDADKKRIVSRVSKNSMPPPEKKISAEDKSLILSHFKK